MRAGAVARRAMGPGHGLRRLRDDLAGVEEVTRVEDRLDLAVDRREPAQLPADPRQAGEAGPVGRADGAPRREDERVEFVRQRARPTRRVEAAACKSRNGRITTCPVMGRIRNDAVVSCRRNTSCTRGRKSGRRSGGTATSSTSGTGCAARRRACNSGKAGRRRCHRRAASSADSATLREQARPLVQHQARRHLMPAAAASVCDSASNSTSRTASAPSGTTSAS